MNAPEKVWGFRAQVVQINKGVGFQNTNPFPLLSTSGSGGGTDCSYDDLFGLAARRAVEDRGEFRSRDTQDYYRFL